MVIHEVRYPTIAEWAARNATEVRDSHTLSSSGTFSFYTVPSGKTLWITSAWISGIGTSGGTIVNARIIEGGTTHPFLRIQINDINGTSMATTFPQPIPIGSGQTVDIVIAGGNAHVNIGFHGYLTPIN